MTLHGFTLTRLATACAAAAALLAAPVLTAPPAQAASLSVVLSCEALGASQFAWSGRTPDRAAWLAG
jgi:hypothetical protein